LGGTDTNLRCRAGLKGVEDEIAPSEVDHHDIAFPPIDDALPPETNLHYHEPYETPTEEEGEEEEEEESIPDYGDYIPPEYRQAHGDKYQNEEGGLSSFWSFFSSSVPDSPHHYPEPLHYHAHSSEPTHTQSTTHVSKVEPGQCVLETTWAFGTFSSAPIFFPIHNFKEAIVEYNRSSKGGTSSRVVLVTSTDQIPLNFAFIGGMGSAHRAQAKHLNEEFERLRSGQTPKLEVDDGYSMLLLGLGLVFMVVGAVFTVVFCAL
jgi:hypothetical protein